MNDTPVTAVIRAKKAVVFDLFHTLASVESSWADNLPSTSEFLGVDRNAWNEQLLARSRERLTGLKTDPAAIIGDMALAIDPTIPDALIRAAGDDHGVSAGPGFVLFDWGNTLMVDFPEYEGPMSSWPRVEAVTHARETLEQVRALGWGTALATNAGDSLEADIRAALARVELDPLIDRVFCSREVGHNKPSPEFFTFIKKALALPDKDLVMVGDDFQKDIEGATKCGIRAVWFRPRQDPDLPAERESGTPAARPGGAPAAPQSGAAWRTTAERQATAERRTIADLLELPRVLQTWRERT